MPSSTWRTRHICIYIDTDSLYNAFYGYQYDVNYTNLGNLTPDQVKARAKELGITPKEFKNRIRGSK